jgi:hypothetical protein
VRCCGRSDMSSFIEMLRKARGREKTAFWLDFVICRVPPCEGKFDQSGFECLGQISLSISFYAEKTDQSSEQCTNS